MNTSCLLQTAGQKIEWRKCVHEAWWPIVFVCNIVLKSFYNTICIKYRSYNGELTTGMVFTPILPCFLNIMLISASFPLGFSI